MKKIITLSALFLGLFSLAFALTSQSPQPRITFDSTTHNFGEIEQGEQVHAVFKFKNTGNAPLVLHEVNSPCSCTVPSWPKEPIAPGDSSEIKAKFNSTGKMGHITKSISVRHNAEGGFIYLVLTGTVVKTQESPSSGGNSSH
jgi:hypothetical protein